ncbi:hypothetical protein [Pelagibacterium xiamenense]|uniref:hypothetical protein n=1 Tax=Pelagibacterium xiamenense TaxID=2901140 RepID=UPI001E3F683C|nr:hypothetical protein [Pelagibacterium xiamenense]MCD7059352.1 hypothetical protein [Pelagibacterium xiamenense]
MWRSSFLTLSTVLLVSSISYPAFTQGLQLSSRDVTSGCASLGLQACDDLTSMYVGQRDGLATQDRDIVSLVSALAEQGRAVEGRSDVNITCPEIAGVILALANDVSSPAQSEQITGIAQALCEDGIQTAAIPIGGSRFDAGDGSPGDLADWLFDDGNGGGGNGGGGNGGGGNGGGGNGGGGNGGGGNGGGGNGGGGNGGGGNGGGGNGGGGNGGAPWLDDDHWDHPHGDHWKGPDGHFSGFGDDPEGELADIIDDLRNHFH